MACVINVAAAESSPIATPLPIAPLADSHLLAHRREIQVGDLPGLNITPVAAGAQQIASVMGELVSEQREARQEATTRRIEDKNKTVDQYFAQNTTILMRLCQVDSSTDLPQVYQDIAKGGKRQERTLLQRAVDQTALDMGYTSMVFPVPPELATKIVSLA